MKLKKKSCLNPLIFGLAWVVIALFSHSFEPVIIGAIYILISIFLIIHDVKLRKRKRMSKEKNPSQNILDVAEEKHKKVVKFREFGFWVESLSQVKSLLSYMQQAVDIAKNQGYNVAEVHVFGGVHELDTGYESFSGKTYSSFEEAKEQLPIDFADEEAKLDGQWLNTINFEFLTVEVEKDGIESSIAFSRGKLTAVDELHEIYLNTKWKKVY